MPKTRHTKLARAKPSEAKLAQIAASQMRLMFVSDEDAADQADRSSDLPKYQDPSDRPRRRRV
jgi:hypothetical protein